MATASLFSMNVTNIGVSVSVPNDDVAKLMYYLHCCTTGVDIDVLPSYITDYKNYRSVSQKLILEYALELKPTVFLNQVIFLDDDGEIVPRDWVNKFCSIEAVCDVVSIQSDIFLAGSSRAVTKVMFFRSKWLETYYIEPLNRIRDSQREPDFLGLLVEALAEVYVSSTPKEQGQSGTQDRYHCSHCVGFGPCTCSVGCSRNSGLAGCIIRHDTCTCDGCGMRGVEGTRYKCSVCYDYDLCEECYAGNVHNLTHRFSRIDRPKATPVLLAPRAPPPDTHTCICDGCAANGIQGTRYKCGVCADYDLCKTCYLDKKHTLTHHFLRIDTPNSTPVRLEPRAQPAQPQPQQNRPVPPPPQPTPRREVPRPPPSPRPPNPPAYEEISVGHASVFFYKDMSVAELKSYLKDNGIAHEDILDKETLCRTVWETHCDGMSLAELNRFLADNNISTTDCRDIGTRRSKAKAHFQTTRPEAPRHVQRFREWERVTLVGLSRQEMNGKLATVLQADCGSGRAEVQVDEFGKAFKVKFENLVAAPEEDELN